MHRLTQALLAILLAASALLATLPASAQQQGQPWPTRGWATSSPEEQGMSSERLARLVEFGTLNDFDSVLVTRHGRIVLEATWAPFQAGLRHNIYSSTKAVVSTLVGMAVGDGLLDSIDRKMVDLLADRTIANLDDAKKAITVRHLLDMTSGLGWDEGLTDTYESVMAMIRSPDWQQFVLDQPMATAPGARFYYSSGSSHLLSAIVSKVTGKSALDYGRARLFGPLGIDDVLWRPDPQGVTMGGFGLYLQPRDMAKIGYLWLRGGQWEGKQVLPAAWIEDVRRADIEMHERWSGDLRYGRQFWVLPKRDAFMSVGRNRQFIVVMPGLDIVAVMTGSARFTGGTGDRGGMISRPRYGFDAVAGYLAAAAVSEGAIAVNQAATAALAEQVKAVAVEQPAPPGPAAPPAIVKAVSGKTWRFPPGNPLRVGSFTLTLDGPQPSFEYEFDTSQPFTFPGKFGGPIGFDGRYAIGGRLPNGPSAARGTWSADGASLMIEVQQPGSDDVRRVTCVFGDRTVEMSVETADGFRAKAQGRADD
jgi:CubicO group peptidase (beta-lactamase class C family)